MSHVLRVLIVEDSARDTGLLIDELGRAGYAIEYEQVDSASSMRAALSEKSWDLVLSDDSVLQFDALAALRLLQASKHEIPFVIVSGTIGHERAVEVMKAGANDYVDKNRLDRLIPVLARELRDASERKRRRAAEEALREQEQQRILELATAYEATLDGWARALDLRDHETEGHSRRVAEITVRLARMMAIDEATCVHIRRGALLHDIGKMGIPDRVLLNPGPLTADEWEVMRQHPTFARELLAPIEFLRPALDIPYSHHEKWDGTGYPQGLKSHDIPIAARIFAVADVWDALRSSRPYRKALSTEEAQRHIAALAGTHLDPEVVATFFKLLASGEAEHAERDLPSGRPDRILVVDDFNAELLRRWLMLDGYTVITAHTGRAAEAALVADRFDLVLLDVMIPEPTGLVVCRRIKDNPETSDLPVILMSGLEPSTTEPRAREAGADDFLPKPVDGYSLRTRVRQVLDGARDRRRP